MWAISRCNFAAFDKEPVIDLGVYRRDPRKHADEPNLLPGLIEAAKAKAFKKEIQAIMGRGRRK